MYVWPLMRELEKTFGLDRTPALETVLPWAIRHYVWQGLFMRTVLVLTTSLSGTFRTYFYCKIPDIVGRNSALSCGLLQLSQLVVMPALYCIAVRRFTATAEPGRANST